MIRHMVLFGFRPEVEQGDRDAILAELAGFPRHFPAMRRFGLGENVSKRDGTFSHVMTMEFETPRELEAYLDSDRHERFVATRFRPNVARRNIASYEVPAVAEQGPA